MNPVSSVMAGRNAVPICAERFPHSAASRCCFPWRVSDSRAKFPWASAVCSMIRASVAACCASFENDPPTFLNPNSAALASIVACFKLTP